jgi:uncharacterized protein (TIGR03083 family)
MKTQQIWSNIHAERAAMADAWSTFTDAQWAHPSWCAGWTTKDVAGHLVASAEQTFGRFYLEMAQAGFRFNVFVDRAARRNAQRPADELVARLRARTTTTNHPPAPVLAMLGEVLVHGEDIRGPLGLEHAPPEAALVAVAENYRRSNLLIGGKRRIEGLRLEATDVSWTCGDGPEVKGPIASLVVAMAGRRPATTGLSGEGVATLADRC